ncbi:hypothetical protein B0T14DRAFT_130406 [Immersiella caudata]|uniref:Nonsense-mediated mRNA decay factor n=1 Tax=Immersiella caudata TaxID=314043 RepID=A0AA39X4K2_9PEZI|nr:hypothetical protein B0T14DRAFT_130406 [Immersiella caudata]
MADHTKNGSVPECETTFIEEGLTIPENGFSARNYIQQDSTMDIAVFSMLASQLCAQHAETQDAAQLSRPSSGLTPMHSEAGAPPAIATSWSQHRAHCSQHLHHSCSSNIKAMAEELPQAQQAQSQPAQPPDTTNSSSSESSFPDSSSSESSSSVSWLDPEDNDGAASVCAVLSTTSNKTRDEDILPCAPNCWLCQDPELIKQPETRPISQEQLVAEVKSIYAGLVMVENKCIEVDTAQNTQTSPPDTAQNTQTSPPDTAQNTQADPPDTAQHTQTSPPDTAQHTQTSPPDTAQNTQAGPADTKLNNEQWQALIALHRTLLHEHHDFFLASQHPSASPALRKLASEYAMSDRMWRHGIFSFLELLRHRLPASLEHMLTFIDLAYSMMTLLYETVPAFEDTWIECLGDLGRYRMAIEDENIRDREVWAAISHGWYSKASDRSPTTGRLYHHLAILARPNALQQLFYYNKSLCVAIPFDAARESIMTLFESVVAPNSSQQCRLPSTEHAFVKTHGIMFSKKIYAELDASMDEFINTLDNHIDLSTRRFLEPGCYIGISNCCAITRYGSNSNPVYGAIKHTRGEQQDQQMSGSSIEEARDLAVVLKFANRTHDVIFRRHEDPNILSYVHIVLVFIYQSTFSEETMEYLAPEFPWKLMSLMLNTLLKDRPAYNSIESEDFPHPEGPPRPLPEDYAMRGLLWAEKYYPSGWFSNENIEDDEKGLEAASMGEERKIRVLYLGCRIAREGKWLRYDSKTHQFSVNPEFDIKLASSAPTESIDLVDLPDAPGRDGILSDVPNSGVFDCQKGGFGEKGGFDYEKGGFGEEGGFDCEKGGFGEKGGFEKGGFGGGFVRRRLFLVLVLFLLVLLVLVLLAIHLHIRVSIFQAL